MQGRASVFAKLQASARTIAVCGVASLALGAGFALGGCASVSEIHAQHTQKDMFATAQDFTAEARARGWSQNTGPGAVNVFLNGGAQGAPTPAEAYLNGKGDLDLPSLADAVVADLNAAAIKTENLAEVAEACATAKSDPASARANLSSVERALIVAKRVRNVLASAVDRVRAAMSPAEAQNAEARLADLEKHITRLGSAADKFADVQRGV